MTPTTDPKPTGTEALVCADIARRQARGIAKYGTTVQDNPLPLHDWLQHAYEECLDMAVYLRRAIELAAGEPFATTMTNADLSSAIELAAGEPFATTMTNADLSSAIVATNAMISRRRADVVFSGNNEEFDLLIEHLDALLTAEKERAAPRFLGLAGE